MKTQLLLNNMFDILNDKADPDQALWLPFDTADWEAKCLIIYLLAKSKFTPQERKKVIRALIKLSACNIHHNVIKMLGEAFTRLNAVKSLDRAIRNYSSNRGVHEICNLKSVRGQIVKKM